MSYLSDLLDATKRRLEDSQTKVTEAALEERLASVEAPRGFASALKSAERPAVIAEIKRRSPSKGALDEDLDAGALAMAYAAGGASAISVLTEPEGFGGSFEDLHLAKKAGLPVLRKDFIIDPFQVLESRAEGADAVLLIVRVIGELLPQLLSGVTALGMDALVEIYDEADLQRALDAGAEVIGINHRDLETFEVDPERTAKLRPQIPDEKLVIGLSGVSARDDVAALAAAGADAVLVGESLVTAEDPAAKLRELLDR
ncbi:MAG TPA: indole-3-glycerol phosphate synthase TrpC [Actinomycetota bacterium]|nr:indole-3-glycerol phosphate synthase TrpC [Actinomycetota bacterium]